MRSSSHFSSSAEHIHAIRQAFCPRSMRRERGLLSLSFLFAIRPGVKLFGKTRRSLALCECAVCVLFLAYNIMDVSCVDGRAWLHILLMWKRRAPAEKMSITHTHSERAHPGKKERKKDGATASFFIVISISCTCSRAREWCPFFREPKCV